MVSLSVVISRMASPAFTASPSCLSHLETVPSSMVSPSWGINTSYAMLVPSLLVQNPLDRPDDVLRVGEVLILQDRAEG